MTTRPTAAHPAIVHILAAVDASFRGKAWQGPTLLGSLRGVSAAEASVMPRGLAHGIWHVALHAAYWKYAICVRLRKAEPNTFPRSPSNWPAIPHPPDTRTWKADLRLLAEWHDRVLAALFKLDPRHLDRVPPGGKSATYRQLAMGIAAHDAYHTGQVQLLKRLVRQSAQK